MTKDQKKKLLSVDHKLVPEQDFYVGGDQHGDKILLRRSGIDKLQAASGMTFEILVMQTVPYGNRVHVSVYGVAKLGGLVARTTASANPDNCEYPNYTEVAEKRCRHRLLLQLLRLYEHNIFSDIESDKFMETRNQYQGAVAEVEKMLNLNSPKDVAAAKKKKTLLNALQED